jgi:hypothetical protein
MKAEIQNEKTLYRPDELARALKVKVDCVYRWCRNDAISHVHFPRYIRITREEYERVLRDGVKLRTHESNRDK